MPSPGHPADSPAALLEVVVPAYNEAGRLPTGLSLLCDKLLALDLPATVLVVDNGSTDATADIVRRWSGPVPVRLLHCARRGKGAAVRHGLLATRASYVGFCDADMATGLDALDRALGLLSGGHPVVVGSRRHPDSDVEDHSSLLRKVGALAFNRAVRDIGGGIADTQCGFKFFLGPLVRAAAADLRTAGFAFDAELLMHCVRRGADVTAIPVVWRDMPGTTFSLRRHSGAVLRELSEIRMMHRRGPVRPATLPAPAPVAAPALAETQTGPV
ncbi:glycosyl transferase family 2 [Actinomadura craniellae]|uniref:Glycosyl transferase family 2 n=1 Tax=Actinomadura craniellae TaxID=2231787 RepID=A0A365GZF4_9ACTN|nr:glycosyltransferase [Actinomadura craniellae]RAY12201.1 glycosyl transferase family 2 [Actinomadura craniellae]